MRHIVLAGLVALVVPAGPATGDWLVTQDGASVETRGPWEVRGAQVVFTLPNGTLSSMPLREVDLDRSVELTAAHSTPAPEPGEEQASALWEIGPNDVPRARPAASVAREDDVAREDVATDEASAALEVGSFLDGLRVIGWEKVERPLIGGVEVVGQLRNANRGVAARLVVTVRLLDDDGAVIASGQAFLDADALAGGRTMGFRRLFEGVRDFAGAEFEISAVEVLLGASPGEEESEP